jgi:hypothetical protein
VVAGRPRAGGVGFQVLGFDWKYIYVNPAAAHHGATTPEALVGRTIWEASPSVEGTALADALRLCMRERVARTLDHLSTGADGRQRWLNIRIEPSGEGLSVYSIDIDDRRATEAAAQPTAARRGSRLGVLRRLVGRMTPRRAQK